MIEPFLLEQAKAGGTGPHQALRLGEDPSPADVEWRGSAAADVEVEVDAVLDHGERVVGHLTRQGDAVGWLPKPTVDEEADVVLRMVATRSGIMPVRVCRSTRRGRISSVSIQVDAAMSARLDGLKRSRLSTSAWFSVISFLSCPRK